MKPLLLIADLRGTLAPLVNCSFEPCGYDIEVAVNGLECLDKLRAAVPDVLIIEAGLLWGGTEGVLAEIRENPDVPFVPIIVIADACSRAFTFEMLVSPVVRCLHRPLGILALREAVLLALEQAGEPRFKHSRADNARRNQWSLAHEHN